MLQKELLFAATRRGISNKKSIVYRNVVKKYKRGIDRLPSQGPDPAAKFKHGWRMAAATVLERYPVVTPEADPFELEYLTERFLDRQKRARPISAQMFLSEKDVLEGRKEPDFSDPHADLYEPAPRVTEADRRNDVRAMDRALDERLYFLVRRMDKSANMQFPQVLVKDNAVSMSDYAKLAFRNVTTAAGRPDVHFMSHSPACHLEHVYPEKYQEKHEVYGLKIFFYRAMLMSGGVEEVRNVEDFAWARQKELGDLLGEEYYTAIKPILFPCGPTARN